MKDISHLYHEIHFQPIELGQTAKLSLAGSWTRDMVNAYAEGYIAGYNAKAVFELTGYTVKPAPGILRKAPAE